MIKRNGFTLIEMLIVLGILSVLLLISSPLNYSALEKQRTKQFFDTFEFDVLYIQNLSTSSENSLKIRFFDNNYKVFNAINQVIETRIYPDGMIIDPWVHSTITFNQNGTFMKPGKIKVTTNHGMYHIVFPLGKGRCYIVEI